MWDKIAVIVVLPWVPAIATEKLLFTIEASKSDLLIIVKCKSLKNLIDSKLVDGVLTTGGKEKAIDNLELLSKISSTVPKDFEFIACGNITYENYDYIHSIIKSKFYHGKKIVGVL